MSLTLLIALAGPAMAGDFIASVGTEQIPDGEDIGGMNWIRVFNNLEDGGWWVTYHWEAAGGSPGYTVARMTDDLEMNHRDHIRLAEWPDTKDHAIARCPDGSFLHAFSIGTDNASARSARYSSDWETLTHEWIEEGEDARAHNDMPLICSEHRQAAGFTNHSTMTSQVFDIATDGSVASSADELTASGHTSGASWIYYADRDQYLVVSNSSVPEEPGLRRAWYNRDLSVADATTWEPISGLDRSFWPQKIERVGDYWVLLFLGVEELGMYSAGDGDVYLAVMDSSFNTVDSAKLSINTPGEFGSARPHYARHGSKLVAVWDKGINPRVVKVQLNIEAFGLESEDTGFEWEGDSDGGGGDGGGGDGGGTDSSDPCAHTDGTDGTTDGTDETTGGHSSGELSGTVDTTDPGMSENCGDKQGCGCSASPLDRRVGISLVLMMGLLVRRRR